MLQVEVKKRKGQRSGNDVIAHHVETSKQAGRGQIRDAFRTKLILPGKGGVLVKRHIGFSERNTS